MAVQALGSSALRVVGLERLFDTLGGLIEAAEAEADWWVGSIVVYAPHLEFGTRFMTARPYFQPAILETGREMQGAQPRTIGSTPKSGRQLWGLMVDDEVGLVKKVAFKLERNVKEKIKEKGLIDTGHLRSSFVVVPDLPRLERESFGAMDPVRTTDEGEEVKREDIVNR